MHACTAHYLSFRWDGSDSVSVQDLRQNLRPKNFHVRPSATLRQGAQIQLCSLRQEVQVQTQATVASYIERTRAETTAMINCNDQNWLKNIHKTRPRFLLHCNINVYIHETLPINKYLILFH